MDVWQAMLCLILRRQECPRYSNAAHRASTCRLDKLRVSPSAMHCLYRMELLFRTVSGYTEVHSRSSEGANPPVQTTRSTGISCGFPFAWKAAIPGLTYFYANETPSVTAPCITEGLTPSLSSAAIGRNQKKKDVYPRIT